MESQTRQLSFRLQLQSGVGMTETMRLVATLCSCPLFPEVASHLMLQAKQATYRLQCAVTLLFHALHSFDERKHIILAG